MATVAFVILVGAAIAAWLLWLVGPYVTGLVRLGPASKAVRVTGGAFLWLSFAAVCIFPLFLALSPPPICNAVDESWMMTLWLSRVLGRGVFAGWSSHLRPAHT